MSDQDTALATKTSFIGWQCRLRQHAVRRGDGRPSAGMRPQVTLADGRALGNVTTVMVKRDPADVIARFRHIYNTTRAPLERYEAAISTLQAVYYQHPDEFADCLTALFDCASRTAQALLDAGSCTLDFEQSRQRFRFQGRARSLAEDDPAFQSTYWHNALFNPRLAGGVQVLSFVPDWATAVTDPPLPSA